MRKPLPFCQIKPGQKSCAQLWAGLQTWQFCYPPQLCFIYKFRNHWHILCCFFPAFCVLPAHPFSPSLRHWRPSSRLDPSAQTSEISWNFSCEVKKYFFFPQACAEVVWTRWSLRSPPTWIFFSTSIKLAERSLPTESVFCLQREHLTRIFQSIPWIYFTAVIQADGKALGLGSWFPGVQTSSSCPQLRKLQRGAWADSHRWMLPFLGFKWFHCLTIP